MTRYISTRGASPPIGFLDAVLAGLAPDGGLYSPEVWPSFTADEIAEFAGKPYAQVAAAVLSKFAGPDIEPATMLEMCEVAYATFSHKAVTPISQIGDNLFMLELFHGPTLAFKDVAMQLLARLYDHALTTRKRNLTIICATSGDTGGAAVEAFRGRRNVRIVALFPEGRISEVQRRFMTTAPDSNVRCLSIQGSFDDCQNIVKASFADEDFRTSVDLSGVNSINWARIAAQSVYYFTAAVALGGPRRPVAFVTPTGNFGDAFAGFVARQMGLPIARIIAATNSNDIVARAFEDGRYARGTVNHTQSPAMDIQIASNFERLYFETVRRDGVETARTFSAFAETGAVTLPAGALAAMRQLFSGTAVDEPETVRTILSVRNETGVLIDPHTAVGVAAARRASLPDRRIPLVVLSTAHPAKFPEAVLAASGQSPDAPRGAGDLASKPERFDRLPADAETVKAYVRAFAGA